jgi:hypothetical protein
VCLYNPFSVLFLSAKTTGNEVIGIDLGTTNSCVSVMEGKVRGGLDSSCDVSFSVSFLILPILSDKPL